MNDDMFFKDIIDRQKLTPVNMGIEERNKYLDIIKNCKDICDSENKVNNSGECQILKLLFYKKPDGTVNVDGFLYLGQSGKGEGRHVNADIYEEEGRIIVEMKVTRVGVKDQHKEYTVFDSFTLKDNKLRRDSAYDYSTKKYSDIIEKTEMKGKIK